MDKAQTDKLKRLTVYKTLIQDKIANGVTAKQAKRPESYRRFLVNELKLVDSSIKGLKE